MKTLIVFIVGVTLFFLYAHSKREEADERAHADLQRHLQVSELSPDVVKNAFAQLDTALHKAIVFTPAGIMFRPQEADRTVIVSLNTPYQIVCHEGVSITFASAASDLTDYTPDSSDFFTFSDYQKNLPFLPESVAGKKLTSLLCARTAVYMQTLQNGNNP